MATARIRVKATDDASGTLKKVQGRIERLRIGIARLRNRLLLATFATGLLTAAFIKVIAAAKIQEDAEKKLNATLRSTAEIAGLTFKELTKMASGLQKVTTFGDEAIIEAQSLLLTFTKIGKDVFPTALKAILDVSKGMGQDLKASTLQLGKALNDPILGIAALTRVGITLSDTQTSQIKKFVELNDVAAAQTIILGELQTQFGGQAEAAKEGLGSVDQLGNAFGDLVEDVGFAIADSRVFTSVINTLKVSFEALSAVLGRSDEEREVQTANQIKLNAAMAEQKTLAGEIEKATNSSSRSGFVSAKSIKREKELREELIPKLEASVALEKKLFAAKKENKKADDKAAKSLKEEIKRLERKLALGELSFEAEKKASKELIALKKLEVKLAKEAGERIEADEKERQARELEFLKKHVLLLANEELIVKQGLTVEKLLLDEEAFKKFLELLEKRKEASNAIENEIARATRAVFGALENSIANSFIRAFDRSKSGLDKFKAFFADFGRAILGIVAKLIARFAILALLTAALGGGTIFGSSAAKFLGFQAPFGGERTVPGPSNQAVPVIAHGGETIGRRGGGGGVTVIFNGITGDPSETAQQVITLIRAEESRTGFGV